MTDPNYAPLPYATPHATPAASATHADYEHLRLLAIFHFVVGGLQIVIGCFPLIHLVIGILIVNGTLPMNGPANNGSPAADAAWAGWLSIAFAGVAILISWVMGGLTLYSGFQIRRHRLRMLSIVVAAINCLHFPFGTTLGVFTLIVLLRRSVEDLYRSTART